MDDYLVIWKSKGVRYRERVRADSEEEAKSKSCSLHSRREDFTVVSVRLISKNSPINQQVTQFAPTFKQFDCSFSTMNDGMYKAHQIALYGLDEASVKEALYRTYSDIIMHTIHIVEVK